MDCVAGPWPVRVLGLLGEAPLLAVARRDEALVEVFHLWDWIGKEKITKDERSMNIEINGD